MYMRILKALLAVLPAVVATSQDFIHGISWFGFETEHRGLQLDWCGYPPDHYLQKIQEVGFNAVRLPFSMDFVNANQWDKMDDFFRAVQNTNFVGAVGLS